MLYFTAKQVEEKINSFRQEAQANRGQYRRDKERIANDPRLSQNARRSDIAAARQRANTAIEQAKQKETEYLAKVRDGLRKSLFNAGAAPSADTILAFRDASDRVESLGYGDEAKAYRMYQRAEETGDRTLIAALISRSSELGFGSIVDDYTQRNPSKGTELSALQFVEDIAGEGSWQAAADYSEVRP